MLDNTADAEPLLSTGFAYRPDPLTPLLSFASSGALGDAPINDTKAQGAFGFVIGRLDLRTGNKGEIVSTVSAKAFSQHRRRAPGLCSSTGFQTLCSRLFESALEGFGTELMLTMDQSKKPFELGEEPLPIVGNRSVC